MGLLPESAFVHQHSPTTGWAIKGLYHRRNRQQRDTPLAPNRRPDVKKVFGSSAFGGTIHLGDAETLQVAISLGGKRRVENRPT